MFEGVILIVFAIVGGLTTLLVIFFVVLGIVRHSKTMLRIGFLIALIPIALYCLTYWFYDIHIPNLHRKKRLSYVGSYNLISAGNVQPDIQDKIQPILTLYSNDSFVINKSPYLTYFGKGTWKIGATDDGHFEFKDSINVTIFWATPLDNDRLEIDQSFNRDKKIVFLKK